MKLEISSTTTFSSSEKVVLCSLLKSIFEGSGSAWEADPGLMKNQFPEFSISHFWKQLKNLNFNFEPDEDSHFEKMSGLIFITFALLKNGDFTLSVSPEFQKLADGKLVNFLDLQKQIFFPARSRYAALVMNRLQVENPLHGNPDFWKEFLGISSGPAWKAFMRRLPNLKKSIEQSGAFQNVEFISQRGNSAGSPLLNLLVRGVPVYQEFSSLPVSTFFHPCTAILSGSQIPQEHKILFTFRDRMTGEPIIEITNQQCPQCHTGNIVMRTDRFGKKFECCTNSKFWGSGNQSCDYRHYFD